MRDPKFSLCEGDEVLAIGTLRNMPGEVVELRDDAAVVQYTLEDYAGNKVEGGRVAEPYARFMWRGSHERGRWIVRQS